MVTDQIADLLTRIRNGHGAKQLSVHIPASGTKRRILDLMQEEGFIGGYEEVDQGNNKKSLKVQLRYNSRGEPVIREMKRLSKPGRRWYVSKNDIPRDRGGLGVVVVSTSKGLLTDSKARQEGLGGELICSIF
jgi:small subunit ribosomal protein S8